MPDIIGTIGGVMEGFKKLREVTAKIKDADVKNQIADLRLALVDLKEEIVELRDENLDLREQLTKTKETEERSSDLEAREGAYFLRTPQDGRPDGPYCVNCWNNQRKLVLMGNLPRGMSDFGKYLCPDCNARSG